MEHNNVGFMIFLFNFADFRFQNVNFPGCERHWTLCKQNDFLKALGIHVWYICHKIQSNVSKIYHTWILWEGEKIQSWYFRTSSCRRKVLGSRFGGGSRVKRNSKIICFCPKKLFNMKNQASSINHLWIIYDSSWFYLILFKYLCWLLVQVFCFSHFFQKWCKSAKRGCIAQPSPPLLGWSLLPFLAISFCIESNDHNPKRERKNVSVPRIFTYVPTKSLKKRWLENDSFHLLQKPYFQVKRVGFREHIVFFQNYAYKKLEFAAVLDCLRPIFCGQKNIVSNALHHHSLRLPDFPLDTHSADWHPWPSSHICACRPKKKVTPWWK